jgi:hypothetical protein
MKVGRLLPLALFSFALLGCDDDDEGYGKCGGAYCVDDELSIRTETQRVCSGASFEVAATFQRCSSTKRIDVTSSTVFATTDPEVLVVEGNVVHARAAGHANLIALYEEHEAPLAFVVTDCSDAATEPSDAAED